MPLLLLTLLGCPWIDDELAEDRYDVDGDGFPWPDDCEEGDPDAFPGAPEWCNEVDDDCDGDVDEAPVEDGTTWYRDADGDGWGVEDDVEIACTAPEGTSASAGDCNDGAAEAHPGLVEVCNDHLDNDCDETVNDCFLQGELPLAAADHVGASGTGGFGYALAPVDLDGDGDLDLAVGAPAAETGGAQHGAVYLFSGPLPDDFTPSDADAIFWGIDANEVAGWRVVALGDVEGDGTDDLLITAPAALNAGLYEGRVYLVRGDDWEGDINLAAVDSGLGGASGYWGYSAAGPGDVTGDGRPDAWVGSPLAESYAGAAYLLAGPITGLTPSDALGSVVGATDETAGFAVGAPGDVDGDGEADLLLGSPYHDGGADNAGAAWLIVGGLQASQAAADSTAGLFGQAAYDTLGLAVDGTGDNNGDGLDDWAAIAPGAVLDDRTGAVFLVRSPVEGVLSPGDAVATVLGASGGAAPATLANAGDVDGDGFSDLAVGLPQAGEAGVVALFYGPVEGVLTAEQGDALFIGDTAWPWAGAALAGLGDLEGDGYDDIGVGAAVPYASGIESAVYIIGGLGL